MRRRSNSKSFVPRRPSSALATGIAVILMCFGCGDGHATTHGCAHILYKIVELELKERGFHDPELTHRKREELRERLDPDLKECKGKRLRRGAISCVERARSTEQISHECLR